MRESICQIKQDFEWRDKDHDGVNFIKAFKVFLSLSCSAPKFAVQTFYFDLIKSFGKQRLINHKIGISMWIWTASTDSLNIVKR